MSRLYRIEAKVFDPRTRRIVKDCGPWHPDKARVESFAKTLYHGMEIAFASIPGIGAAEPPKKEDAMPVVTNDAGMNLDEMLATLSF